MGLFHHVLVYMGDLQLVYPVLHLSTLDAGILIMVQCVSLMMFSFEHGGLTHVLPLAVKLEFFCWTSTGDHSKMFLLFEFCCGTPPSCLKVRVGGGGWVVAWSILVSAKGPLVLVLRQKGFGRRVWGQGLKKIT